LIEKIRIHPTILDDVTIFRFDHDHGVPAKELKNLLGGKGSGLAEMTRALGIAVPPGFTIPLTASRAYRASGWPEKLGPMLDTHMDRLGAEMGRCFGDPNDPLLVAVRSGAPVSMPGMLDTVLNLGLNDQTVLGLATASGDELFAWDSYRRFIQMFATTVMGVDAAAFPSIESPGSITALKDHVGLLLERVIEETGSRLPSDPSEQLRRAITAVFDSWDSARAKAYRSKEGIDESMGTAVNVQAMVFGNRGDRSGTGVVFTRDPSTGEGGPYGDYLPQAQGEDVVAGTAHTLPISALAALQPEAFEQLVNVLRRLEVHYRDMCDVEFTIEEGRLWLLQTRTGKRSAVAAVKIAADLANDPDVHLTPDEAMTRVPAELRERARNEVLARASSESGSEGLLARGLGASPGRVCGKIVLDSEAAADSEEDVILVRSQTSPEDVAGMASSVGILTTSGGLVSHAAVVARGWGIPAVVGAREIVLTGDQVLVNGVTLHAGDLITIDGTTGEVWLGVVLDQATDRDDVEYLLHSLPELAIIEQWAAVLGEQS
jgi:pyruvate,orthophosphate dikinase